MERPDDAIGFALYGPRFQREPAEFYRRMRREHGPVAPVVLEGDVPAWLVLGYREVWQVTGNPHSIGQALNEVLWEDTPTQNFPGRWATRNTELGGRLIREGDLVALGLAAANIDPEVRPHADIGRSATRRTCRSATASTAAPPGCA